MTKFHYRDSTTGRYLTRDEALQMDESLWTEETDFDKGAFLDQLFVLLENKITSTGFSGEQVVSIHDIKEVFNKFGANLDSGSIDGGFSDSHHIKITDGGGA